jgi:hypothetical protein
MLKDDKKKERVAKFEEKNSGRYSWLLDIRDADGNPIGIDNICINRYNMLLLLSRCEDTDTDLDFRLSTLIV